MDKKKAYMQNLTQRIQAYLRAKRNRHEVIPVPPFSAYLHRTKENEPEANCVIPNEPVEKDITPQLAALHTLFAGCRTPVRFQYLDAFTPTLTSQLAGHGYREVENRLVMICTPDTHRPAPAMPGLSTVVLSRDSSLDDVRQGMQTNELGFDPRSSQVTDEEADIFRERLVTSRAFILRLNGEPVSAGMFTEIRDGLTELVGISTLSPYRRRGFGAYLTGYMTQMAFARRVDTVFLLVEGENGAEVYRRVGFKPYATLLTYQES